MEQMKPYYEKNNQTIYNGDCLEVLKELEENSVDAIVTDPPYGLSFMGKKWDYDVPSIEVWQECLRVIKPGGHLLSFAGSRTYHRMAVNIEDAGFEIRDQIMWVYGSGFPKSLNIGKAVDKLGNVDGVKIRNEIKELIIKSKKTDNELSKICDVSPALIRFWRLGERTIQKKEAEKLKEIIGNIIPNETQREKIGTQEKAMSGWNMDGTTQFKDRDITKGTSEWEGWGTALKPAHEPICMARKPLSEKTVAENCLKWGTGGINIDESRVGTEKITVKGENKSGNGFTFCANYEEVNQEHTGRFPANFIHDGIQEDWARYFYCAKASKSERNKGLDVVEENNKRPQGEAFGDGSAITEHSERKGNFHPTVKPIALMEYLIKMITPKGGTVLDPFMGSGTTGMACKKLKRPFIGIEMEEEYCKIAQARIEAQEIEPDTLF